jgi:hypothetical protein
MDAVDNQRWIFATEYFFRAEFPELSIPDSILKNRLFRAGYQGWIPNLDVHRWTFKAGY